MQLRSALRARGALRRRWFRLGMDRNCMNFIVSGCDQTGDGDNISLSSSSSLFIRLLSLSIADRLAAGLGPSLGVADWSVAEASSAPRSSIGGN